MRASRPAPVRPRVAGAALGYLLLTLVLTYPLLRDFGVAIPGDSFDAWQNYWNQWWLRTAIVDRHISPYFTDMLYAPTGVSLLFHTLNPFNGLFTLPVQLAWGLIPAYNTAVVFSFAAGGLGAYLLARQALGPLRHGRPAAFVAGVIFTFAPFHVAHLLGHLQLIALEWLPFYTLYLWRLLQPRIAPRLHDALLAALFLILVGLCDWYYVFYCLILTLVLAVWAGLRALSVGRSAHTPTANPGRSVTGEARGRQTELRPYSRPEDGGGADAPRRELAGSGGGRASSGAAGRRRAYPASLACVALAGALFALVFSPLLIPMLREASTSHFMVPNADQSRLLSADLLAFVTPQEFHPLWGAWARGLARNFTATVSEHQVFTGFTTLLLATVAGWAALHRPRGRQPDAEQPGPMPWLLVSLVFFLLALGPVLHINGQTLILPGGRELPLPYALLARLPFVNISRSVSRFDVMVMLGLAISASFGLKWLSTRWRRPAAACALALGLVIFEFWPAPYPMSAPDTPAWYAALAADASQGAVLNLPMNWDRPWYLLYQTVHGKPLAVAYISRDDPRTLTERAPVLQHLRHLGPDIIDFDLARQGQQVLRDLGIRWVVLDRYKMPGARERGYNEDVARQVFSGQAPYYEDGRLTVYEVAEQQKAKPEPYIVLGQGWEPLQDGSRAFTGRAALTIRAPSAGKAALNVTLAPGSAGLAGASGKGAVTLPQELAAGDNVVELRAGQPGERIVVSRLALVANLK